MNVLRRILHGPILAVTLASRNGLTTEPIEDTQEPLNSARASVPQSASGHETRVAMTGTRGGLVSLGVLTSPKLTAVPTSRPAEGARRNMTPANAPSRCTRIESPGVRSQTENGSDSRRPLNHEYATYGPTSASPLGAGLASSSTMGGSVAARV